MKTILAMFSRLVALNDEYRTLLALVQRTLSDDIRTAEKEGWDDSALERTRTDIRSLLGAGGRIALILLCGVFFPLAVAIVCLITRDSAVPAGSGYGVFAFWVLLLSGFALWKFWPLISILRSLRGVPPAEYRQLVQPMWINLDLLNITVNISLMLYVILSFNIDRAYPIIGILSGLWLFGPLILLFAHLDGLFLSIRLVQFLAVVVAAFIVVLSPVPMQNLQWWGQKRMAEILPGAAAEDITAQWESLQWFTPTGLPLVWYSERAAGDYCLFSGPGRDTLTNQERRAVGDSATRERIVVSLRAKKDAEKARIEHAEKTAAAALQAKQDALAKENEIKAASEAIRAIREKEEAIIRAIGKYIAPEFQSGAASAKSALVVTGSTGVNGAVLSKRFERLLNAAGAECTSDIFLPAFASSSDFDAIKAGRVNDVSLKISNYAARLVLIQVTRKSVAPLSDATREMVSIEVILEIRVVACATGRIQLQREVVVRGVGFKEDTAYAIALDRAEPEIREAAGQIANLH